MYQINNDYIWVMNQVSAFNYHIFLSQITKILNLMLFFIWDYTNHIFCRIYISTKIIILNFNDYIYNTCKMKKSLYAITISEFFINILGFYFLQFYLKKYF